MKYDFTAIEKKWQEKWLEEKPFTAVTGDKTREKFYGLIEFPYPSGQGLHVGHARPFTAMDIICRKKRMQGYNVLFPIGFDAFGLPTENYAIKNHIHPAIVTKQNIANFTKQLHMLGYSFDWDRVVDTTDPSYYKWTQWIFLQLFKKGLAYKASMPVNWCTSCKCVLANEEVVNGVCERCGSEVVHRVKSQWMLKITAYADKLIDGLDGLDYIERVATQQKNWIGRSHGAEVNFGTTAGDTLTVYTTRCDTLFGATYMVVSPEHAMVKQWLDKGIIKNVDAVKAYQAEAARKSDFERSELNKEKTGVKLEGVMGINPVNDTEIPIFISDYVLSTYGTGAIMAVPAHDDRDWEFARKFGCEIIEVVSGGEDVQKAAFTAKDDTGILVNSGFLCRYQCGWIDFAVFAARSCHNDILHTGHLRRNDVHQDRGRVHSLTARHIDTDGMKRCHLLPENDARFIGIKPGILALFFMIFADIYQRLADHRKQFFIHFFVGLFNLILRHKDILCVDASSIKTLCVIKDRCIAVCPYIFYDLIYSAFKFTIGIRASF